jgi:hypothetical protein
MVFVVLTAGVVLMFSFRVNLVVSFNFQSPNAAVLMSADV